MKMIIYKFYADWCEPCKKLSEELNKYSDIITDIDSDDPDNIELFKKYNVKKLPFIIFADSEGNVLKRLSKGSEDRITLQKFEHIYNELKNGNI